MRGKLLICLGLPTGTLSAFTRSDIRICLGRLLSARVERRCSGCGPRYSSGQSRLDGICTIRSQETRNWQSRGQGFESPQLHP